MMKVVFLLGIVALLAGVCDHGNNQFLSEGGFDLCLSNER